MSSISLSLITNNDDCPDLSGGEVVHGCVSAVVCVLVLAGHGLEYEEVVQGGGVAQLGGHPPAPSLVHPAPHHARLVQAGVCSVGRFRNDLHKLRTLKKAAQLVVMYVRQLVS